MKENRAAACSDGNLPQMQELQLHHFEPLRPAQVPIEPPVPLTCPTFQPSLTASRPHAGPDPGRSFRVPIKHARLSESAATPPTPPFADATCTDPLLVCVRLPRR